MLGFLSPSLSALAGPLPADHERLHISQGYSGTAATIAKMQQMVSLHKRDFEVRTRAGQLIQSCPGKDYYCYAKKLYEYCRDGIRYAFDPARVELVESPGHVFKSGIADCDSVCVTLAALAESIGLHTRYVTVKGNPQHPHEFSHVYLRIYTPPSRFSSSRITGWVGADPTLPDKTFGWEPPASVVVNGQEFPMLRQVWPGSADETLEEQDEELAAPSRSQPIAATRKSSPAVSSPASSTGAGHSPRGAAGFSSLSGLDWLDMDTLRPARRDTLLSRSLADLNHIALGDNEQDANKAYNDAALLFNKVKTVLPPSSMSAEYDDKLTNWQNAFGQADTLIMNSAYEPATYILNALKDDMTAWLARIEQSVPAYQRQQTVDIINSLPGPSPTPPSPASPASPSTSTTDWGKLGLLAVAGAVAVLLLMRRDK